MPRFLVQAPSEAGWPGSKPGPGLGGLGVNSSRPGDPRNVPRQDSSLDLCSVSLWAALTLWCPQDPLSLQGVQAEYVIYSSLLRLGQGFWELLPLLLPPLPFIHTVNKNSCIVIAC